jgi:hypothetical protein
MVKYILYCVCFLISAGTAFADTHTAATCSLANVQTAYNAASAGDTVSIPAGSCTWSGGLTVAKSITIIGATTGCPGSCSGSGTRITGEFDLTLPGAVTVDISQLTLITYGIYLTNTSSTPVQNLRIHHNEFVSTSQAISNASPVSGPIFGLIDHNKFTDTQGHAIKLYGSDAAEWSSYPPTDANRGTANSLYIEDNIFAGGTFSLGEGSGGMRMTFRYNTANMASLQNYGYLWDAHGIIGNPNPHCDWEIYENTVTGWPNGLAAFVMSWRGGGVVAFNNSLSGPSAGGGWTFYWDLYLDPPNETSCVYLPQNGYFWNNINTTNGFTLPFNNEAGSSCGGLGPKVAYWADFTEGVGGNNTDPVNNTYFKKGLFSARPATPTAQDVYWATDTRVLYRAKTTNTWSQVYTPYTYPHPLQGGGSPTYTLTYAVGTCASITGTNPQSGIESGHDGTQVTAVPATGYHFVQWDDALATAARTDTNVTADHTYTASCAVNSASGRRSGGVAAGGTFR